MSQHRSFFAVAYSFLFVLSTALAALVVEDLLPNSPSGINVLRIPALIFVAVLLGLVARARSRADHAEGTLYYVRVQADGADDWHKASVDAARKRSLDHRSVTRAVDLGELAHDLVSVVRETRQELERAANDDVTLTGFTLAPNALWPVALALGYDWPLPDACNLEDYDQPTEPVLRWRLAIDAPAVDVSAHVRADAEGGSVRSVLLSVHLTDGPPGEALPKPAGLPRVQAFEDWQPDVVVRCGVFDGSTRVPVKVVDSDKAVALDPTGTSVRITAQSAAQILAGAIRHCLDTYGDAVVVVAAQVPKTVAPAAGRLLAESGAGRRGPPPPSPWRRLILLHWHGGDTYAPMRVRSNQPERPPRIASAIEGASLSNLTPHDVVLGEGTGGFRVLAEKDSARLPDPYGPSTTRTADGIDVVELPRQQELAGLPAAQPGTAFIVSRVAAAATSRDDVLFPFDEIRDESGRVQGCRRLARFRD